MRGRLLAFVAVFALCVAAAIGYGLHVAGQRKSAAGADAGTAVATAKADALPADGRFVVFRSSALDDSNGRLGFDVGNTRSTTPLPCDRVYYAAGRGICLQANRGAVTTYRAVLFDRRLQPLHLVDLAGPPSRARLSADGRLAAMTVFVSGHSYGAPGFSTRTTILDVATGQPLVDDLEKFEVLRDGKTIRSSDFNFWGVTFTPDGRRFYATLGTGGRQLLVEGDLAARRLVVVHDNVECPSLSPDGRRVAFKRREPGAEPGRVRWALHVLDLPTRQEMALKMESRDVDDQVEWLDDREIAYALPSASAAATAQLDVWALAADGSAAPRLMLRSASSPSMVHRATAADGT